MLFECKIKRSGGTEVKLDDEIYRFIPDKNDSHVCDVKNPKHVARFLEIPEAYIPLDVAKAMKIDKKLKQKEEGEKKEALDSSTVLTPPIEGLDDDDDDDPKNDDLDDDLDDDDLNNDDLDDDFSTETATDEEVAEKYTELYGKKPGRLSVVNQKKLIDEILNPGE